ncbi:hypothetical protein Y037_3082 [Burkholderia pseudomallei MSHR983]|uniref:DUF2514 family protein n=1 Tax=Burkholderia pseudomallei TaxID=28450 RepID=UPI0005376CB9|nr:DUF2514 family protein [Burkholderia pseudomallei]KGU65600.1 hypothetical protein Y037_3082 [Burkholderia pseudomallei MSHR983]KGW78980.1 hypothetical protein Y046_4970 [Burkholderia pseudomallei MSHR2990]KGX68008.1 hypothetical protein Y026_1418 [Burkholderia pseudomallei TSV28]KIX47168.1 hypothetical protein SY87_11730 [Burkholderia pseudomallei]
MIWIDPRFWLAVIVAIVIGSAGGYFKGHDDGVRTTTLAAQRDKTKAVEAARAEEQRRTAAQMEIAKHASKQRDQARADAAAAASAADGLRKQVAVLGTVACRPAASVGSAPAVDPIGVLADVLGRIDDRAGELAKVADERGIAGQQCERSYDALMGDARTERPE